MQSFCSHVLEIVSDDKQLLALLKIADAGFPAAFT
jgi:hypothetical protein